MQESPELQEMYGAGPEVKNLVDTAKALEGLTRHSSTHAAGLVISSEPLDDVVPLQKPIKATEESVHMTQYPMDPIAALGLLKMDFLGLVNLTILAKARDLIAKTRGTDLALRDIPLDDAGTFDLLSRGDTVGVFQLEGAGMTRYIKELMPSSLGDVAAMIALYRPGPMEHITTVHRRQARPDRAALSSSRPPGDPRGDLRRHRLPGPGSPHRQDLRRLHAGRGRHRAQGHGQEDPGDHGPGAREVHGGGAGPRVRQKPGGPDVRTDRAVRGLRVQQGPQRQLRSDLLLDRPTSRPTTRPSTWSRS